MTKKIVVIAAIIAATLGTSNTLVSCKKDTINTDPTGTDNTDPKGNGNTPKVTDSLFIRKYGKSIYYYAEVDKAGEYFRRMFIDSVSARIVKNTGTIPDGAIVYLETWFGASQSTVYIRQKVNGKWEGNSFSPSSPNYSVSTIESCNSCHAGAAETDATYTLPLLQKALSRNAVQKIFCNQSSFNPCSLDVYKGN